MPALCLPRLILAVFSCGNGVAKILEEHGTIFAILVEG